MAAEVVLILPPDAALPTPHFMMQTPYGRARGFEADGLNVLVREEGTDARTLIYTAKELGARRVLAGDLVGAISGLLEPGDWVIPTDVIDQTRLKPFTFFVGKGYGFIKLNPPFCPDLAATLLSTARRQNARTFRGGIYLGADGPRDPSPAERRMFRSWGVDVVGSGLLPEVYLARELELCYAAITVVEGGELLPCLKAAAAMPVEAQHCTCQESLKLARESGLIEADWHTWLG